MTILGIDLGTTNSACAIWQDGQAKIIPNRLQKELTPSVVGIDDGGEILVGETAKHRLISHPAQTVAVFKRAMGSQKNFRLGRRDFNAVELSSLILQSLKDDAEQYLGESITQAVISVPAYFNDVQRKATKQAGELAGLTVERLINEPTAAAMAYGLQDGEQSAQFIVLDMGGGTFDVSLVEYFSGVIEVHASSGDNFLGGEDFTTALLNEYCSDHQLEPNHLSPNEQQHLYSILDRAKQGLSNKTEIVIEKALKQQQAPWSMHRDRFEKISSPLLQRIQAPVEKTLRDSKISLSDIDQVVLVGGATRMQVFRSLVSKMFRRMPSGNINPDLVVAIGTAIQSGLKEKNSDLSDVVLTDVCPYSLGTGVLNEADKSNKQGNLFLPIIERNCVVPISIEKTLYTTENNQTDIELNIYQGESRLVKNNIYLGQLNVKVPKAPAGKEAIDVRYSYDMNGLLEIDVTVASTGKLYQKTIVNSPGSLSEKEIEASKKKLSALKFHPRDNAENRNLIARAESLYESALDAQRDYIGQLISEFDQVLEQQNPKDIQQAAEKLNEILEGLEKDDFFS